MNKHIAFAFAGAALLAVPSFAEDQGAAIAAAAQDAPSAVSVSPEQFVSASDKVQENLGKLGLTEGYNAEKKTIIVIGSAYLASKDLNVDKTFMIKRSAKAMEAYLNAKAEIIRAFNMEFSAEDKVKTMAEFGDNEEQVAAASKLNDVQAKVAAFAEKAGKPELADADLNDDLVATLKGLDIAPAPAPAADALGAAADAASGANSTAGAVIAAATAAAGASLSDASAAGNDLAAERDALVSELQAALAEAKAVPMEPVNETTSTVSLLSKMPLLGATVLTQAESWDRTEGVYEIAMAVLWSPKLQEEAKGLASGNPVPAGKPGKLSAQEWVAKQDLLAVVGPRRFTDKDGNAIVVGIAARDLTGIPVVKIKAAKQLADTDAMKAVATSLLCDLQANRSAEQHLAEFEDDSSKASEKLSDEINSKTSVNLSGVLRLSTKEGLHPISGRKIYVAAYYLDPNLSKDAMERIKQMYADAITVENASQYKRGQLAGMEAKLEEARTSTEKFEQGKAEAAADVAARVKAEEMKAKVTGPQGSSGVKQGDAKGGAVSGDNLDTVDLDF